MKHFFKNEITLKSRDEIARYTGSFRHDTSGLTFTSLYMWRNQNLFSYEIIDDFLCIAGYSNFEGFKDEPFVFPLIPAGGTFEGKDLAGAMAKVIKRFEDAGCPFVMRLIPKHMERYYADAMQGGLIFLDDRDNFDYLYDIEGMASLSGRRYHSKKNHVNHFDKEYAGRYEVLPMSADLAAEALKLLYYIDGKKDIDGFEKEMLAMEQSVLEDILQKYDELGFSGCAIKIDGRLEAYAFGAPTNDDTIVEHIEKANIDFPGLYQKVNNEFCKMMLGRYKYVNREEDMGLAGLRQAKESYKPLRMIEKSIAMLAGDEEAIRRYSL